MIAGTNIPFAFMDFILALTTFSSKLRLPDSLAILIPLLASTANVKTWSANSFFLFIIKNETAQ